MIFFVRQSFFSILVSGVYRTGIKTKTNANDSKKMKILESLNLSPTCLSICQSQSVSLQLKINHPRCNSRAQIIKKQFQDFTQLTETVNSRYESWGIAILLVCNLLKGTNISQTCGVGNLMEYDISKIRKVIADGY